MTTVFYLVCDHGDRDSTCATRTDASTGAEDRSAAWKRWEAGGWVHTGDGRHLCPFHSGRRR